MSMACCVGIDVGATKTHLRAVAAGIAGEARILSEHITPSQNWRRFDWEQDADCLAQMINQLGVQSSIKALCIGANGCDEQVECDIFAAALSRRLGCPVRVVNDSELIPPALGIFEGIGLVCGTGAIAVTRNQKGDMLTAGGWGWVIGDEGSAAGLVREAARLACLHLDLSGARDDPLIDLLCQNFGIDSPVKIGTAIHTSRNSADLGRHAPVIFAAAKQGSRLAAQTLQEGALALVELVQRLHRRGATANHVVAGGSVIVNQPDYASLFLQHFDRCFAGKLQAHICHHPPVQGACALAEKILVS